MQEITFSESKDLSSALNSHIGSVDVLYVPTDNVCADNVTIIDSICREAKVPVIAGEESICKGCGVATLSIDYFRLGQITGEMALEILLDGKSPSELPIRYDENTRKLYNKEICDDLGITVPAGYEQVE